MPKWWTGESPVLVWPWPSDPDILPMSLTLTFFILQGLLLGRPSLKHNRIREWIQSEHFHYLLFWIGYCCVLLQTIVCVVNSFVICIFGFHWISLDLLIFICTFYDCYVDVDSRRLAAASEKLLRIRKRIKHNKRTLAWPSITLSIAYCVSALLAVPWMQVDRVADERWVQDGGSSRGQRQDDQPAGSVWPWGEDQ